MKLKLLILTGLSALAVSGPNEATASLHPGFATTECQLHLWPTRNFKTNIGSSIPWRRRGDWMTETEAYIDDAPMLFSSAEQTMMLREIDLPRLLNMADAEIVEHPMPMKEGEAGDFLARRETAGVSCYAEFVVGETVFENAALSALSLRSLFTYQGYEPASAAPRKFTTWAAGKVARPKKGEPESAYVAALAEAFRSSARKFAGYATRPPRR